MLAYREMSNEDLFTEQWVKVTLPPEELPGYKGERIVCAECGEGINFQREVREDERFCAALRRRAVLRESLEVFPAPVSGGTRSGDELTLKPPSEAL